MTTADASVRGVIRRLALGFLVGMIVAGCNVPGTVPSRVAGIDPTVGVTPGVTKRITIGNLFEPDLRPTASPLTR